MGRPVYEHRIIAPPDAIDELGHVNNAVWVQWIQEVALAHWYSLADPGHQEDYIWVVVRHEIDYLRPAFEGDVTYPDGEVVEKIDNSPLGIPLVQVKVKQTTQEGEIILTGTADVELPY